MDTSEEFLESVSNAIDYFRSNPNDKRVVFVHSKRVNKYFINSLDKLTEFYQVDDDSIFEKKIYKNPTIENTNISNITKIRKTEYVKIVEQIRIFAFDFDLTLTSEHSRGTFPNIKTTTEIIKGTEYDYFNSQQYEQVLLLFKRIKSDPENMIYIISRGVSSKIKQNLANTHPELLLYVECIFGAIDDTRVSNTHYDGEYWARKKCIYLKKIKDIYSEFTTNVYFFDDTENNVNNVNNMNIPSMKGFIIKSNKQSLTDITSVVENATVTDNYILN